MLATAATAYTGLEIFWFLVIAVLWVGYFALEGFDFGVGMLLPVVGKTDLDELVTGVLGTHYGDTNLDGKVSFLDYLNLEANFGKSIPEPATLSLLAFGGLAMLRRRRAK